MTNEASAGNKRKRESRDVLQEAMQQHRLGNAFEADLLYAESLYIEPDNDQALRLRGILARETGDLNKSLHLLGQATQAAPNNAKPLGELALSYMASGKLHTAEKLMKRAVELDPTAVRIITNLGAILQHRGHVQSAIDLYRQALDIDAHDIGVRCNLARALSDIGQSDLALAECELAVSQNSSDPHVLATRGAVLIDLQHFAAAREVLEEAVQRVPNDDMTLVNLALACYELGDITAACDTLQQAVRSNPFNARAVADLANSLTASADVSTAIALCTNFLSQHPGERQVLAAYALALHNANREAEAAELTDCSTLVRSYDVPCPDGYSNLDAFNTALAIRVLTDPSLINGPGSKATAGGDQTGELDMQDAGCLQALGEAIDVIIQDATDAYIAAGLADHPLMALGADCWSLRTWGTVLQTGGQQISHMHPLGWLSGVYYVTLPEGMEQSDEEAGWLEFGRPPDRFFRNREPALRRYQPATGKLILFPSWFWHQTVPFIVSSHTSSNNKRISIAFDVIPRPNLHFL